MFGKIKCPTCGNISDSSYSLRNSGSVFCSEICAEKFSGDMK